MPAAVEQGWPTYAVSLRGHGASERPQDMRTVPLRHYVHDVLQTITELPEPPVLVGHSMGGLVVQHVLERYPARAGVLVAPVPPDHGLDILASLARHRPWQVLRSLAFQPIHLDRGVLLSDAVEDHVGQRYEERLDDDSPLVQFQLVAPRRSRPSRAPVLVVGAGADRVTPPHGAVRTARHYGTRAHLFRGLGHDLMLEADWKAPLDLILHWLDDTVAR